MQNIDPFLKSKMTLEEMDLMKMSSKIEAVQEEEEAELPDNNNDSEKENLMQTVAGKINYTLNPLPALGWLHRSV